MAPLAFVSYQFWSISFVLGLLTQNVWITLGIGFVMTNAVVWISDHASDPIDIGIIFHLWYLVMQFLGALTGVVVASALLFPKMAFLSNLSTLRGEATRRGRSKWTKRTVWVFVFIVSLMLLIIGINIATCRVCAGGSGMSPINLPDDVARIVGWVCVGVGALFLLVSLIAMYRLADPRGSITAKYVLASTLFINLALWVHDIIFFPAAVKSVVPGLVYLLVLVFGMFLFALVAWGIPASPTAKSIDKIYRNMALVRRIALTVGIILFIAALTVLIVIWITDYEHNNATLVSLGVYTVVVIIAVLIYGTQYQPKTEKSEAEYSVMSGMSVADELDRLDKLN